MNYSFFLHDVLFSKEWGKALMEMPDAEAGIVIKLFAKYIIDGVVTEEDKSVLDDKNRKTLEWILVTTKSKSEKRYKSLFKNGIITKDFNTNKEEANVQN